MTTTGQPPSGPEVEIVLVAEAGALERQAVLLCASLRRFAGKHADAPITVVSPRPDRRPGAASLGRLAELGVRYLPLDIDSVVPEYGTTYRMYAAAELERMSTADRLLVVDSDLLFAGEPDLVLGDAAAALRPVDVKGVCTEGAGDPNDVYWRQLCELCGVDYDCLPWLETPVGRTRVKASYNGGFVLADRRAGIFARTLDYFQRSVAADLAPSRGRGLRVRAGHGWVSERGSEYWGASQICLSLAIWGSGLSVRELDLSHNFPLNHFEDLSVADQATRMTVVHYHHLLEEDPRLNPLLDGRANLPSRFVRWLEGARAPEGAAAAVAGEAGPEAAAPGPGQGGAAPGGQRLVVVLGMHRSGTSAIARGLEVLGVRLGGRLQGPHPGVNDKGFFEDVEIHDLDVEMLEELGHDWDRVAPVDGERLRRLHGQGFYRRAVDLLRRRVGSAPVFGFKDPRLAMLLPFWQQVFAGCGLDPCYVIALRNPLSVARSLARRDRIQAEHAYLLWLGHTLAALVGTMGMRRVLVDFDDLMQAPDRVLGRVGEVIGLAVDGAALDTYRRDFLDDSLRHTVFDLADLAADAACPALVSEVFGSLRRLAVDGVSLDAPVLADQLGRWLPAFAGLAPALSLIDRLLVRQRMAERSAAARNQAFGWLHGEIRVRDEELVRLHGEVRVRDEEVVRLHGEVAERDRTSLQLRREVGELAEALARSKRETGARDEIVRLQAELGARDSELATLGAALAQRDEALARLQAHIDRDIHGSLSWRLTAPLRLAGRAASHLHGLVAVPDSPAGGGAPVLPGSGPCTRPEPAAAAASPVPKVICVHPRFAGMTSHHFNESYGFRQEFGRRGTEFRLLVNRRASAQITRALDARAVLDDPTFRLEWSFAERTRRFADMLHAEVDADLNPDDRVMITVSTQLEAHAFAHWLRELPEDRKPWLVVLFLSDRWNRSGPQERERQVAEFGVLRSTLAGLAAADARRLIFFTLTDGLAEELEGLLGHEVGVVPMPLPYAGPARYPSPRPAGGLPRVAVLGGTRREKGSYLIPDIVRCCQDRVAVEFLIHLATDTLTVDEVRALAQVGEQPGVTVIREPMSLEEYNFALSSADIGLFPYEVVPYRKRTSGVFAEAVAFGKPVIATRGTWMAEQMEAGRAAGVVAEDLRPEAFADAIAACVANLGPLRQSAHGLGIQWRNTFSLASFVDRMEEGIRLRSR